VPNSEDWILIEETSDPVKLEQKRFQRADRIYRINWIEGPSAQGQLAAGEKRSSRSCKSCQKKQFIDRIHSTFRVAHVIFVNRALSEVSQAELNCLRNVKTGQFQAVAVGLEVIQNRAHLFSCVPIRCPGSGSRNVQRHSPFIVL